LIYQGYTRVVNMDGGINKWASKGFPIRGARAEVPAAVDGCCGASSAPSAAAACCAPAPESSSCCGPATRQGSQGGSCC